MSTQSDAIRDYFHENGISNRDVAERLGVHEGSVSNILSGRYGISKKIAARLTDLYGFNMRFLMTGEGSLLPPGGVRIAQHHNTNTGDGAGAIHLGGDAALRQQVEDLQRELEREREEKARLLGIIETMTGR